MNSKEPLNNSMASMNGKVLIVDDEPDIRELLEITLGRMSLETRSASCLEEAYRQLAENSFDICLTDMRLPDGDGISLVERIQAGASHIPVAVITAHGNTESAIRALKAGAFDFVSKPLDLQKLRELVNAALKLKADPESESLQSGATAEKRITGESPAVVSLREQIRRVARSQAPVFIRGESGSGKELAARAIHELSARRNGPFVAVNCGAIPAELMESELFGHLKGSFTGADRDKSGLFEAAREGTLFLDEVADLPLHMQVKLLRVIQEKSLRPVGSQTEVATNVRILSASHKNLANEIDSGSFRQDLYYRINVIELAVPALRERREDIPVLATTIMEGLADEHQCATPRLSSSAIEALQSYPFPGNVRELENILQRAFTLSDGGLIKAAHLALNGSDQPGTSSYREDIGPGGAKASESGSIPGAVSRFDPGFNLEKHLENIERQTIEAALVQTRWNKTAAARKLGLSFRSLRYRLKKLGLD